MKKEYIKFCNKLYKYLKKINKNLFYHVQPESIQFIPTGFVNACNKYFVKNTKKIYFNSNKILKTELLDDSVKLDFTNQSLQLRLTVIQYLIDNKYNFTVNGRIIKIKL